jgi:hypothetical protein
MKLIPLGRDSDYRVGYGEMGHSIDLDLLPDAPVVLDAGCRGFAFSKDILKLRPKARIIALDPDPLINPPNAFKQIDYWRIGLVATQKRTMDYISTTKATGDGGANFLIEPGSVTEGKVIRPESGWLFTDFELETVACANIQGVMRLSDFEHFDVVKLDIEGQEFPVLENWPGPIATQISVEFHDFTGPMRHRIDAGYYTTLMDHLGQWYRFARHEWIDLDGHTSHLGHWDSVLVLKSAK